MEDRIDRKTKGRKLETAARIALGLLFAASGANHILALIPMPPMAGATAVFWSGLAQSGYFFPLLGCFELLAGCLMLANRLVPLALTIAAPVALNMAAFHAALAPQAMGMVVAVLAAMIDLARRHRTAFTRVLASRSGPATMGVRAGEIILGVTFVASGLSGLTGHTPPPATPGAAALMQGFAAAGYFLPALSVVQVAAGAMLIARRWVGLALIALAPIVVEIVAYRLYVAGASPRMLIVAAAVLAAELALAFAHRESYAPLAGSDSYPPPAGGGEAFAASRAALRA
jgi:hypothetical protein